MKSESAYAVFSTSFFNSPFSRTPQYTSAANGCTGSSERTSANSSRSNGIERSPMAAPGSFSMFHASTLLSSRYFFTTRSTISIKIGLTSGYSA